MAESIIEEAERLVASLAAAPTAGLRLSGAEHSEAIRLLTRLVAAVKAKDHQQHLLADVLGRLIVALGGTEDVPMTGPELLLHGEDAITHFRAALSAPGDENDVR